MKFIHFTLVALLLSSLATSSQAHTLSLNIDKIKHIKGVMMIALYNSESSYKTNTNIYIGKQINVTGERLLVNFENVATGEYAIKLYQDENENQKLDSNLFGVPNEGYGFSNNGGALGQPSFTEAKFTVDADSAVTIHLR